MSELKSFDRVADVYDQTRSIAPDAQAKIDETLAREFTSVTHSPRVIETGIGTGRIAVPLAERGVRVVGIDISTAMVARLRQKRADIPVVLAEASRPPFRGRPFDGALFVHVLHLVPDPVATVREVLSLLQPGGVAIEVRDDRWPGPRAEADDIIRKAVLDLSGVDIGGWSPYDDGSAALARELEARGADVRRERIVTWEAPTSGRRILDRLTRRDYSSSWKIPESIMSALLERVEREFDARFGGVDREFTFTRSVGMTAGRLPRA